MNNVVEYRDMNDMSDEEVFEAVQKMAEEFNIHIVDIGVARGWQSYCAIFVDDCTEDEREKLGDRIRNYLYGLSDIKGNKLNVEYTDEQDNECPECCTYNADDLHSSSLGAKILKTCDTKSITWLKGGIVE